MVEGLIHISINNVYHYKSIMFEWHRFCGPLFLRLKDGEIKEQQQRPLREYGLLAQWINMPDEEKKKYLVESI